MLLGSKFTSKPVYCLGMNTIKKGYRHLFHKLILFIGCFGEVFDVILKPLNVPFHVGQTAF